MNKKGFTLVEILAVIVVLAIIMIIAIPNINDAFSTAKNKLSDIETKNIKEASETIILEVINCDIEVANYNELFSKSSMKCSEMQNETIGKTIETTVDKLKEKGYFNDTSNKCSGSLLITTDTNYKVSVNTSNIICN